MLGNLLSDLLGDLVGNILDTTAIALLYFSFDDR